MNSTVDSESSIIKPDDVQFDDDVLFEEYEVDDYVPDLACLSKNDLFPVPTLLSDEDVNQANINRVPLNTRKRDSWSLNKWKDWSIKRNRSLQNIIL